MAMLGDRRARVLRAVVQDFIESAEPVGSKTLTERYRLGVSAATVRNELAALEDEGFLSHPHTSAGRIPTDLGYRFYVDRLSGVARLARSQRGVIALRLAGSVDMDETLQRTSQLLSSVTHYAAMVAVPALESSRLRHVELVALGATALLVVLVLDTGRVEKLILETEVPVPAEALERWRGLLNARAAGGPVAELGAALAELPAALPAADLPGFATLARALAALPGHAAGERVYLGGQANLSEPGAFDGMDTLHAVYEALEQQVLVLDLLRAAISAPGTSVLIGTEHQIEAMRACSLVLAPYAVGDAAGTIAVLGPTRMDYLRAMAAVQAVARYLGETLGDPLEEALD